MSRILSAFVLLALAACGSGADDSCQGIQPSAGCTRDAAAVLTAQEGHACSTDRADEPQLVCSLGMKLVCISTYSRQVAAPDVAAQYDGGVRPVFVCRFPCATVADCPQQQGDVCCPGIIHGAGFGKKAGCVPASTCESLAGTDGGS